MAWSVTNYAKTPDPSRSVSRVPIQKKSVPAGALLNRQEVGKPVRTEWSTNVAIEQGLKLSSWVYACVEKRATSVAGVPLVIETKGRDGRWMADPEHPAQKLINTPNPKQSRVEMATTIVDHLDLGGNAILSINRVAGRPDELWVLPPDKIKPIPDRVKFISGYQTFVNGQKGPVIKPEDIVHFAYIDPSNPFWGISPLMAGARVVDMDIDAVNWNKSAMKNRAVPDGMITFKQEMDEDQFDAAQKWLEGQVMGAANNRRPLIAGSDARYERFSMTMAEMDFIESRKMNREEICALYGTPPPMVGIYDNATLANIREAREIYWEDTIDPLLKKLLAVWNRVIAIEYGEDVRAVYDTSGVEALRRRFNEKVETSKRLFDMGVPFNEINQRLALGFMEITGGDIGWVPINLQPATESGNNASIGGLDDEDDDD